MSVCVARINPWCYAVSLLSGYNYPVDEILEELVSCLDHPALPLLQWNEEFSYVENRLPPGLGAKLNAITTEHELALNSAFSADRINSEFPGRQLIRLLREAVEVSHDSATFLILSSLQKP